jgi:hypothetical protein
MERQVDCILFGFHSRQTQFTKGLGRDFPIVELSWLGSLLRVSLFETTSNQHGNFVSVQRCRKFQSNYNKKRGQLQRKEKLE